MDVYIYSGPVMIFDRCVENNYKAVTRAASEAKARNNLTYRWKVEHNLVPGSRVILPGKLEKG